MSFPRYPKYKDSGVEWLGEVPEHWGVTPLKYVARFTSGGTPSKTMADYWNGDVPWASSKDLKSETLSDTCDHITQLALDEGAAVLVPAGRVLVVVRGMILLHTFPVVQTLVPMAINQDVKAVAPANGVAAAYLPWLLRGSATETFGRVDEAAHGTKVLRMESWTSIALPIPPRPEQAAIASFLDRETTKIDALIAEQQRLIELLQEKRQAVISHAVTKGLNPDAPMKDSGIGWLGAVPEHWVLTTLRRVVVDTNAGEVIDKSHWGGDLELLYTCAIEPLASDYQGFPATKRTGANDLLLTRNGTPYVHKPQLNSIYTNVVQRVTLDKNLDRDFMAISVQNAADNLRGYGVSIESLNYEMWKGLPLAVPPFQEQKAISSFLDRTIANIGVLSAEAQSAITLLQERRSALISAAVTGQIDVRGLAGSEAA